MKTLKEHIFVFNLIMPNIDRSSEKNDSIVVEITTGKNERVERDITANHFAVVLKKALLGFTPQGILRRKNKEKVIIRLMRTARGELGINFHDVKILKLRLFNTIKLNGELSEVRIIPKQQKTGLQKYFSFFNYILKKNERSSLKN